ncbi:MAG: hypothetical protein ACLP62_06970 [Acidimicrobiales bacterium]
MGFQGNVHLTMVFTVSADQVAEGDRLFASHGKWMETSHPRSGELALLSYNVSKGAELANPLDPGSEPTGKTTYVLDEIYESEAGVANHWKLSSESWADFGAVLAWAGKAQVTTQHRGRVINSLS